MRNDVEAKISPSGILKMEKYFEENGYKVVETDTTMNTQFPNDINGAKKAVDAKINELGSGCLVLTDRLHGMVLTALSNTNCIVFSNYNYKVKGVYNWIKDYPGIYFWKKGDSLNTVVNNLNQV